MVHSSSDVKAAYRQALQLMKNAPPGFYKEMTVFMKEADSLYVYARKRALPLGEGGFEPLVSGRASEWLLATATLTHGGETHTRVVISCPLQLERWGDCSK